MNRYAVHCWIIRQAYRISNFLGNAALTSYIAQGHAEVIQNQVASRAEIEWAAESMRTR